MGGASSTVEPHRLLGCGGLGINDLTCPCMERSAVVCKASRPNARLPRINTGADVLARTLC